MIYDANEVLQWAMDPNAGGLHPGLFGPGLLGISFMTIVEIAFLFSGNVGTGIIMARRKDGSWSPPSAIGISGLGWGFIVGASVKHIVYLIYDRETIKAMSGDVGVQFGAQVEASLGNWGRTAEVTSVLTNKGMGQNVGLSYSSGVFGGISVEGAVCNPRSKINEKFYGKKVRPSEILFEAGAVEIPEGTLYPEILAKLELLCGGSSIYMISEAEMAKRDSVRVLADKEGEEAVKDEEVEYSDLEEVMGMNR